MKKKPTKLESEWMGLVADLGCIICQKPAEIHHITGAGMGKRSSNYEVIPLCENHHRLGGYGMAVHSGTRTWEKKFGSQIYLLKKVKIMI